MGAPAPRSTLGVLGYKPNGILGNQQAETLARLCWEQYRPGHYFSIENLAGSMMWEYTPIKQLLSIADMTYFDQCQSGFRPPPNNVDTFVVFLRKPTFLLSNMKAINKLKRV